MTPEIQEWHQRAEQAALLGDARRESEARRELATRYMAAGDGGAARAALERTLVLSRQLDDADEEARTLYALALLQQRVAPKGGVARRLLEEAEAAARRGGDLRFLARVLDKRAGLLVTEGKPLQAAKLLNDVAALHGTCGDEDARLDVLRRLAMLLQVSGKPGEAFDLLLDALAESRASPAQLVRARLELHLLARGTGIQGESLQQLLDEAVADGDLGAAGYIRLQMAADALQARDAVGGEAHADAARRDALDCTDPILYLNACLMIAEAREQRGDRVGMLTILFTCKASLQDILGEQGARPVLALIQSLEARWGPEVFGTALEAYRAQFR